MRVWSLPLYLQGYSADVEEVRRRLYVVMTRAREDLILITAPELAPFLEDLPDTVVRERASRRERPAEQISLF